MTFNGLARHPNAVTCKEILFTQLLVWLVQVFVEGYYGVIYTHYTLAEFVKRLCLRVLISQNPSTCVKQRRSWSINQINRSSLTNRNILCIVTDLRVRTQNVLRSLL